MHTMEFIFGSLGPNKVTQQITPNEFEETNFTVKEVNLFDEIENPLDILRSKKLPLRRNDNKVKQEEVSTDVSQRSEMDLNGVIRAVLGILDPTTTLLSHDSHIVEFKKKLVMSAEVTKKSIVRGMNVKELVAANDLAATKYLTFILKKSIALHMSSGIWSFYGYPDHTECLVLKYDDIRGHFISEAGSPFKTSDVKLRIVTERGVQQKLNSLLVKDLKELAAFLDIPTVDPSKKPLLKQELTNAIANHLKLV